MSEGNVTIIDGMAGAEHGQEIQTPAASTASQLASKLEQQVRLLASRFRSVKPRTEFSPSEWLVLTTLYRHAGIELKDLAHRVKITASATAKVTRTLAALGYVEWRKDPTNRRLYVLAVTAHGQEICQRSRADATIDSSDWFRNLTERDLETITLLLDKCVSPPTP